MTVYESAEDFFEAVREAVTEVGRIRGKLSSMEQSEGVRAAPMTGSRGGSRDVNGMGRTDARIDLEATSRRILAEDEALIAKAEAVVVGLLGHGGVGALLSWDAANVLDLYYLHAETWAVVANCAGMSESWCRAQRRAALDLCDAYGIDNVLAGRGIAGE